MQGGYTRVQESLFQGFSIQHSALLLQGDPVKARHNTQLTKSIVGQASHVRLFGPAGRWKNRPPTTKPTPTPKYAGPFSLGMALREKGKGWGGGRRPPAIRPWAPAPPPYPFVRLRCFLERFHCCLVMAVFVSGSCGCSGDFPGASQLGKACVVVVLAGSSSRFTPRWCLRLNPG